MIELIFVYFAIQQDLMTVGLNGDWRFCRRLQVVASFVETKEIYDVVEQKWADDESKREQFYAFWENVDTCSPHPPRIKVQGSLDNP
ncbi:hypothetical protein UFOVP558_33 [uncultured Caudovirales phage]|uniref:Uncharacterized protein n=1 Tax=uncultured Caudovirales phage TaxID=2100421 RepID=A0A6J5MUX9_9CAUD|nr:hypothetical protein UFOVP558_33 [uncultured Caudovirales phage]